MILITGACGFIGRVLYNHLSLYNNDLILLDNLINSESIEDLNHELIVEDICDKKSIDFLMQKVDYCIHLAAYTDVNFCESNQALCNKVNVFGSKNIFESAVRHNVKVIYASSAAVYGNSLRANGVCKEDDFCKPISTYGLSKLKMEEIANYYSDNHSLNILGLRLFNLYGNSFKKDSSYSNVIKKFIEASQSDREFSIFGDGQQTRDFIYLNDVIKIIHNCLDNKQFPFSTVNVGTGIGTSINELLKLILKTYKIDDFNIFTKPSREEDINFSTADITRLRVLENNFKPTKLSDGISLIKENQCKKLLL